MYGRDEKVFYAAGDLVRIKHNIDPRPVMVVEKVDKATNRDAGPMLLGITCFWFSDKLELQKSRFNTKDLEKVYA